LQNATCSQLANHNVFFRHICLVALSMVDQAAKPLARPVRVILHLQSA